MTRLDYLALTAFGVLGIALASATPLPMKLVWNATASRPVGFYTIDPLVVSGARPCRRDAARARRLVHRGARLRRS